MSYWKSPACCELCQTQLTGTAEIITLNEGGRTVLIVKQSMVIDWSFCHICRNVICRASCFDPKSGCCKACANDTEVKPVDFNERAAVIPTNNDDDILSAETIFQ